MRPRAAIGRSVLAGIASCVLSIAAGCSSPVSPTPLPPPELSDVIEALFLGSGPLAAGDCAIAGVWTSYTPRSTVTLLIASTVDEVGRATLERAVADVQQAIADRFRFDVQRSPEADPSPGPQQITSADVPAPRVQATCSPGGAGCVRILARDGPLLSSVQAIQLLGTSERLKIHEFGHAIGLCHVNRDRVPSAVMADPPGQTAEGHFSDPELRALRTVYESPLEPGATRAEFIRAGLTR